MFLLLLPGVAGGYSPKALRALYNTISTNFAFTMRRCWRLRIGKILSVQKKNIRAAGLAYSHIVMFSLRIQVKTPKVEEDIAN